MGKLTARIKFTRLEKRYKQLKMLPLKQNTKQAASMYTLYIFIKNKYAYKGIGKKQNDTHSNIQYIYLVTAQQKHSKQL